MKAFTLGLSLVASAAALAILPASAVSAGQPEPVYYITYYADAAMTQQVGYVQQTCDSWGVGYGPTFGVYGPYEDLFLAGYCLNGELVWL